MSVAQVHRNYKIASFFILMAVCAGILKVITVYWKSDFTDSNSYIGLFLNSIILALFIWLAINISKGKNWARITFAVCAACMLIFAPYYILNEFSLSSTIAGFSTVFGICLLVAILLLYSKGARQWYTDQLGQE